MLIHEKLSSIFFDEVPLINVHLMVFIKWTFRDCVSRTVFYEMHNERAINLGDLEMKLEMTNYLHCIGFKIFSVVECICQGRGLL